MNVSAIGKASNLRGGNLVMTALRGGQIDVAVEVLSPVLPQIKGGALRALAVTGQKRNMALPKVPTAKESGVPNFVSTSWNGLGVPAKTPQAVVDRLNKAFVAALQAPETKTRFGLMMAEPVSSTPEQFAAFMKRELSKYEPVVKASGARVD